MSLQKLELTNLRCFESLKLELPSQLIVTGANGRGKSTILEALTLLSLTRSHRTRSESELIRTGESAATITGVLGPRQTVRLAVSTSGNQTTKQAKRSGRLVPLTHLVGQVRTVLFTPDDLELFSGAPRLRRRLLDGMLIQREGRGYAEQLISFHRALKQRNALLAQRRSVEQLRAMIGVWDLVFAEAAAVLVAKRTVLATIVRDAAQRYLADMGIALTLGVHYRSTVPELDRLAELLTARLERDRDLGSTSIGPHRDDLEVTMNSRPMTSASRGEQRAILVALKLAESDLVSTETNPALFLVDDLFSELDPVRRDQVASYLRERPTIITSADPGSLPGALSSVPRHEL